MDNRYKKSSGIYCSVIECNNSAKKRHKLKLQPCNLHNGKIKMYCGCESPFQMFKFPIGLDAESIDRRRNWIANIKRKDFVPCKSAVVCSDHFIEGKPTKSHPYPEINLGHNEKITKSRKAPLDRNVLLEDVEIENNGLAELKIDGHAAHISSQDDSSNYVCFITPRAGLQTSGRKFGHNDHTYTKPEIPTIDHSTQTNFSDFLNNENIGFSTGLPSMSLFLTLIGVLQQFLPESKFRSISITEQLLLVLIRLRLGLLYEDLSFRFGIKKDLTSKIFSYWVPIISTKLSILLSFIPSTLVHKSIPGNFKQRFTKLKCMIDCTEVFPERPLKLRTRAQMYSNYKSHQTAKYLVGIAPNGLFTFLSAGYSGRASDLCVVRNSGFLDLLQPLDEIMADRGFNIEDDLKKRRAKLIIPTFTRGKKQLQPNDVIKTRRIANSRIHIERAIGRIKTYRILNGNFPINQLRMLDDIMRVICILCNLKRKLIR